MTDLSNTHFEEKISFPITKNERNRKFGSIVILIVGIGHFFLNIGILFCIFESKDNVPFQWVAILLSFIILGLLLIYWGISRLIFYKNIVITK